MVHDIEVEVIRMQMSEYWKKLRETSGVQEQKKNDGKIHTLGHLL